MKCRDAEKLLYAERDGVLDPSMEAALKAHLSECAACRRMRESLAVVADAIRASAASARVPDARREWWEVRRRIRLAEAARTTSRMPWLRPAWLGTGLATVCAAVAGVLLGVRGMDHRHAVQQGPEVAWAESVELADRTATPVVYVDDETGWLVVWSVAGAPSNET